MARRTDRQTHCASGGYTLIEMLVVTLIIGVLLGTITTYVRPGPREQLDVEARRLAQLLNLAATESRLTGRTIRWTAEPSGYRFLRWQDNGGWSEMSDSDLLRPRNLPPGILLADFTVETMRRPNAMRLHFMPNGAPLTYRISLSMGETRAAVEAAPFARAQASIRTGAADGLPAPR